MTAIGEMITTVFLLLNIVFCAILAIMDTHSASTVGGTELDNGFNLFYNVHDLGDLQHADDKRSHHNARAALLFTFVGLGIYIMQFVRQVERMSSGTEREYKGRWTIVVEAGLAFLFAMVAMILVIVEAGAAVDEINRLTGATGDLVVKFSIGFGWIAMLLITLMNLFIFVRTSMLAYMADSWPKVIGAKGSFGSGSSARVAEQYPVMGTA